jgi:hypothetical protein
LNVLYGGLGISTRTVIFDKKNVKKFSTVIFFSPIFTDQNPGSRSELTKKCWIRIRTKCGSTRLISTVPECGWTGWAGGPHRLLALTPLYSISRVPECGWAGEAGDPHRLLALTPLYSISRVPECGWAGGAGCPHRLLALTPLKLSHALRHAQTPLSDHLLSSLLNNSCCCCYCFLIIIAVEEVGRWRGEELHAAAWCCAVAAHLKQQEWKLKGKSFLRGL